MSLEGGLRDRITGGRCTRRIRPMTQEQAINDVPTIVILLKKRKLQINKLSSRENLPLYVLKKPRAPEYTWAILEEDFNKIKEVASEVDTNLFRSEPDSDVIERIRSRIKVKWPHE